jgi:hypothetical protein
VDEEGPRQSLEEACQPRQREVTGDDGFTNHNPMSLRAPLARPVEPALDPSPNP